MNMRAAAMLPLKAEPVVGGTKDSSVESINELHNSLVEKLVSDGRVLLNGLDGFVVR